MPAAHAPLFDKCQRYTPLFDKIQRHTHRYSTNVSGIHPAIFDKVDVHNYIHTTRACVHIFAAPIPNKFASIRTTTIRHLYNSKTPQFESTSKSDMRVPLRIGCCAACRPTRASPNESPSRFPSLTCIACHSRQRISCPPLGLPIPSIL